MWYKLHDGEHLKCEISYQNAKFSGPAGQLRLTLIGMHRFLHWYYIVNVADWLMWVIAVVVR